MQIDTTNKFLVGKSDYGGIHMGLLTFAPISSNDALLLAAYLVILAEPTASYSFEDILKAIKDS